MVIPKIKKNIKTKIIEWRFIGMKIENVRKNDWIYGLCTNYNWYRVLEIHWQGNKIYVALERFGHLILNPDEEVDVK